MTYGHCSLFLNYRVVYPLSIPPPSHSDIRVRVPLMCFFVISRSTKLSYPVRSYDCPKIYTHILQEAVLIAWGFQMGHRSVEWGGYSRGRTDSGIFKLFAS